MKKHISNFILSPKHSEKIIFKDLWFKVTTLRKSYYADKIRYYEDLLSKNPKDKKAILELAKYYTYNNDYGLASKLYKGYLVNFPNDLEIQYQLAQILMWQNYLCEAAEVAENLVHNESLNLEYLLLAAKINLWLEKDLDYTIKLYQKVLIKDSLNSEAMYGLGNLYIRENRVSDVEEIIEKISLIDSSSNDFNLLVNKFNAAKGRMHCLTHIKYWKRQEIIPSEKIMIYQLKNLISIYH